MDSLATQARACKAKPHRPGPSGPHRLSITQKELADAGASYLRVQHLPRKRSLWVVTRCWLHEATQAPFAEELVPRQSLGHQVGGVQVRGDVVECHDALDPRVLERVEPNVRGLLRR